MTAISKRNTLVALLMTLCLLLALAVPAFAEEATVADTGDTAAAETVADTAEADTADGTNTADATEAGSEAGSVASTEAGSEAESETSTTADPVDHTKGIINLVVGALILIAIVVLAIVFRAKIPVWFKAVKSECGKIVWCPKDKLKKNTVVVVVIILALTVLIGLLDFAFSRGLLLLSDLFK